jgi:hypothetical protein
MAIIGIINHNLKITGLIIKIISITIITIDNLTITTEASSIKEVEILVEEAVVETTEADNIILWITITIKVILIIKITTITVLIITEEEGAEEGNGITLIKEQQSPNLILILSNFKIRPPQMSKSSNTVTMASKIISIIEIFKTATVTTITEVAISAITPIIMIEEAIKITIILEQGVGDSVRDLIIITGDSQMIIMEASTIRKEEVTTTLTIGAIPIIKEMVLETTETGTIVETTNIEEDTEIKGLIGARTKDKG